MFCAAIGPSAVSLFADAIGRRAGRVDGSASWVTRSRRARRSARGARGRPRPGRRAARRGPLNVNADEAAAALAVGLGADRIVFVSDVPGVLVDGEVASVLRADDAEAGLAEGVFEGGIVPKLMAAVSAGTGRRAGLDRCDRGAAGVTSGLGAARGSTARGV